MGAGILFTISVLWYWGSKRKVMALDSQKVLLADLFRVKHPADEDDRHAAALPVLRQLCSCGKSSEGTLKACWWCNGTGQMLACYLHALMLIIDVVQHLSPVEDNHSKERGPDILEGRFSKQSRVNMRNPCVLEVICSLGATPDSMWRSFPVCACKDPRGGPSMQLYRCEKAEE